MLIRYNGTGALEDPLTTFDAIERGMSRLFADYERRLGFDRPRRGLGHFSRPAADQSWKYHVTDDAVIVSADLPGFNEGDVVVSLEGDTLTVKGAKQWQPPTGYKVVHVERSQLQFSQSWELPVEVNADAAEAVLKDGVFTLRIPKAEAAKPRKISVRTT